MKEGWEVKKLGDVCEIYQPKTISTNSLVENGKYLVYGANGIIGKYDQYNHIESELLMTCRGATCGTINISEPYSWINGNAMVIHPIEGNIIMPYLKYVLSGIDLSNVITGAAQPQITRQSLSPLLIPIPPLSEQSRIVEELDQLSNIIEKKRQQLSELDNLAQSIFYDMFGDPVTNEKGWEVKKLSEISNIISGFAFNSSDFSSKNTIKAIKITNVGVNEFIEDDISLPSKYNDKHNYMVKAGDVVIALTRTVISTGVKRAIVPVNYDGALVNQRVAAIVVDENVIYKSFLYHYLGTDFVKEYVLKHASALMQPNLSINDLKKTPIYYPPLQLQQLFAQKIEAIEKEKELIKQSIKETEELFNSRMDYYFG